MTSATAVRSARPAALDDAARSWHQISADLDQEIADWKRNVISPLESDWSGRAARAALTTLSGRARDLIATREYSDAMATIMTDAATGIAGAQAYLRMADDLAARHGLVIGDDGSAGWQPPAFSLNGLETRAEELVKALPPQAAEATAMARKALALADETDTDVTTRLQEIGLFKGAPNGNLAAAGAVLAGAGALGGTLARAAVPARGTSPTEVSSWWKDLSGAERQHLISDAPSQVGWLDGLPVTVRDKANRLQLTRERSDLEGQLQALDRAEPRRYIRSLGFHDAPRTTENPAWQTWHDEVTAFQGKLQMIRSLDTGLNNAGLVTGPKNVYLLGFDTDGNGHGIVALGNPDTAANTAANTATYVPGLGSHLGGSVGDIKRAIDMYQQAGEDANGQSVSSVYWLGYNAPQLGTGQGLHNLDVTGTHDAAAGGASLSRFQTGLNVSHQPGTPSHTTVIGHSYGSVVVGEAAARSHMHPNDIIFVGSPGVGVNHASQLGISPSHVWAGAISADPVPDLSNPTISIANPDSNWFGNSPVSGAFGGRVFNCENHNVSYPFPGLSAHSAYWSPQSSSLLNMANIVAGRYGAVGTVPALPIPPGPESTIPLGPGGI